MSMQKYSMSCQGGECCGMPEDSDGQYYRVDDVDERIAEMEQALREIMAFDPGNFRELKDEIAIWRIAKRALGDDDSRPEVDYRLIVTKPDETGRICITSPEMIGLVIYAKEDFALNDIHSSVTKLRELNARPLGERL